jgi:UrcA family protein
MYTTTAATTGRCALGAAAVVCMLFAGNVKADHREVTVAIRASAHGLDLSQPAGAKEFYVRLKYAAYVACTRGDRVGLAPSDDPNACYEKALAGAIRSANRPLVTQLYLAAHTLREASARGVVVPAEMAAAKTLSK